MSLTSPTLASVRVTWAKVDTGFWVAHRGGEYFGCVDAVAGGFVSRDAHGIPIGRYDALGRRSRRCAAPRTPRTRAAARTRSVPRS